MPDSYNVSMTADFFTVDGLQKKTGLPSYEWQFMIFKELMDNALDAVEPLPEKEVSVIFDSDTGTLEVYDNGGGISERSLDSIYDFSVYHSSKRLFVTPSRGKQGNGLKTVIGVCHVLGYSLQWYTREGHIKSYALDTERVGLGELPRITETDSGATDRRGVVIQGIKKRLPWFEAAVSQYAECNPDVTLTLMCDGKSVKYGATAPPCDRSDNTNVSFYTLKTFTELLQRQDPESRYKSFLRDVFGVKISNASSIKSRVRDIDTNAQDFTTDFAKLKSIQGKKKFTALKKHLIGLPYCVHLEDRNTESPCIVEFNISELPDKPAALRCFVYMNNTITYEDARSVSFKYDEYQAGNRQAVHGWNLETILEKYPDYEFTFHFVAPVISFTDTGKTEFDISGIIDQLAPKIKKALSKTHREYIAGREKPVSNRDLMRQYLPDAYRIASSNGRYTITARQIFYKLRELSGIQEGVSTYADFTQGILTEWLDENPTASKKVYLADRGKFYVNNKPAGLGTGSVLDLIEADGTATNTIHVGGISGSHITYGYDFDLRHRYNKILYTEKTGFDEIFQSECLGDKYNVIIASGQGFATRAAKTLLDHYQEDMIIYCLHDLDYHGVDILNALRNGNRKFEHNISVVDLGITLEDVELYGIQPELVKEKRPGNIDKSRFTERQQIFFFPDSEHCRRVELNAFTTEQILEIIDRKLNSKTDLPKVNLMDVMRIDEQSVKEAALMELIKKDYAGLLSGIALPARPMQDRCVTVPEAVQEAKTIVNDMIAEYQDAIREKFSLFGNGT